MQVRQKELAVLSFSLDVAEAYIHGLLYQEYKEAHCILSNLMCILKRISC